MRSLIRLISATTAERRLLNGFAPAEFSSSTNFAWKMKGPGAGGVPFTIDRSSLEYASRPQSEWPPQASIVKPNFTLRRDWQSHSNWNQPKSSKRYLAIGAYVCRAISLR